MKRETTRLPKFKRLKRLLQRPDYQVVGVLELLWELTAAFHEDGAIGRWSNDQIADSIEWDGDAGNLVMMLVAAGWLDEVEDPSARLVVHDWYTHVYPGQWDRIKKRIQRAIAAGRAPAWQVQMFERARVERSAKSDDADGETSGSVRQRPDTSPPSLVLSESYSPPHHTTPPPAAGSCGRDEEDRKTGAENSIAFTDADGESWHLDRSEVTELASSPAYADKVDVDACLQDLARRQRKEPKLRRPAAEMLGYIENWLTMELRKFNKFPIPGPAKPTGPTRKNREQRVAEMLRSA